MTNKLPRLALKHNRLTKEIDAIERGNCIHQALSVIEDYNNVDTPIENLYATKKLTETYITCEEMKTEIRGLLEIPEIRQWFKPGLRVLNERTILGKGVNYDGSVKFIHRPDRVVIDGNTAVVIDYKTGEHERVHQQQVQQYMRFLSNMKFKPVYGYLLYTNERKLTQVR